MDILTLWTPDSFRYASFYITINNGLTSDYNWTSDAASWVTVSSSGRVQFTALYGQSAQQGKKVTVTATPKEGNALPLQYSFQLKYYYEAYSSPVLLTANQSTMDSYCGGLGLSALYVSSGSSVMSVPVRGQLGYLWNEWGALNTYSSSFFPSNSVFFDRLNGGFSVNITTGLASKTPTSAYPLCNARQYAICSQIAYCNSVDGAVMCVHRIS